MKALQDRLAAMNLKMTDLRNQMQSVKQELRMAQKVFQSQAPSLLVGPGLGSERGLAGTKGSIQDQRVLSPVSIMLLPLGQAPDPETSFQQLLKQTHVVSGVAGWLRDPAYMPCGAQPTMGRRRTVLSSQGGSLNCPRAVYTTVDPGSFLHKPPWTWEPAKTRLLSSAVCNIRK